MNWAATSKPLSKLAGVLAAAGVAYPLLRNTGFYEFTGQEAEGLNTLILLIGSIYAVMLAFVIFVIWGQFTDVENAVMRECTALTDLLRFSQYLNADGHRAIRRAVGDYAQRVIQSEWPALGERKKDQQAERSFTALMNTVIRTVPANPAEETLHQRLIDIARSAAERRGERIAKSLMRIPPTLLALVNTMAAALLLLVFAYPFHQWVAGISCFVLVTFILFFANLVMTDTDNPFSGVCNISSQPFSELTL